MCCWKEQGAVVGGSGTSNHWAMTLASILALQLGSIIFKNEKLSLLQGDGSYMAPQVLGDHHSPFVAPWVHFPTLGGSGNRRECGAGS